METLSNDFFKSTITQFIKEFHPDLALKGKDYIENEINLRSSQAYESFEESRKDGLDVNSSLEIAFEVLKQGLLFSKYQHVKSLMISYFFDYLELQSEEDQNNFILNITIKASDVFERYVSSDVFHHSDKMDLEVIRIIQSSIR
ncbi:DUF1896 family protein [Alistipes sp. ZOR0009]|uniref:DUF1896 family protein n=1 Tax=Alistipes sp. ZOR0009 TaxID=1339253 RepID=UPI0006491328|nr:DUF1896 family protein [Alistipes sp. ZOR0009]